MKVLAPLDVTRHLGGRVLVHAAPPLHKAFADSGKVALGNPILQLDKDSRWLCLVATEQNHISPSTPARHAVFKS